MKDDHCVTLLQWALPQLHMRWPGFRKVRGQVCKRIVRRLQVLGMDEMEDYRHYLEIHPEEWQVLDSLCQVTISRFYRDKLMFAFLAREVLPELARHAIAQGKECINVWSAGCSSGEEPYTIALIWRLQLQSQFPELRMHIIATDANPDMRQRFERACYAYSSIKNLPVDWRDQVFTQQAEDYCLKPKYRSDIRFKQQDIRETIPSGIFDLVLCRNIVFTYFDEDLQRATLESIKGLLRSDGAFVIGIHEHLPTELGGFKAWSDKLRIFRKEENSR